MVLPTLTPSPPQTADTIEENARMNVSSRSGWSSQMSWRSSKSSWHSSCMGAAGQQKWSKLQEKLLGEPLPLTTSQRLSDSLRNKLANDAAQRFVDRQISQHDQLEHLQLMQNQLPTPESPTPAEAGGNTKKRVSVRLFKRASSEDIDIDELQEPSDEAVEKRRASVTEVQKRMSTRRSSMNAGHILKNRLSLQPIGDANDDDTKAKMLWRSIQHNLGTVKTFGKIEKETPPRKIRNVARGRIKRMQDRMQREREATELQRKYHALLQSEKDSIEEAFLRFDADCSGTLDWEETTACLRELGIAGTNTVEKREIRKICREAMRVSQAHDSSVLRARQESAQQALRQHHQVRVIREVKTNDDYLHDIEEEGEESPTQKKKKMFAKKKKKTKEDVDEDAPKIVAPKRSASVMNKIIEESSKKSILSTVPLEIRLDKHQSKANRASQVRGPMLALEKKKPEKAKKRTSTSEDAGNNDGEKDGENEEKKDGEDGEDGEEKKEELHAKIEGVDEEEEKGSDASHHSNNSSEFSGGEEEESEDEDFAGFSFDLYAFAILVLPKVRARLMELQSNKMLRYFCHFDRTGAGNLTLPQCMEICRVLGLDTRIFGAALEEKGFKAGTEEMVDFESFELAAGLAKERSERSQRNRETKILEETGLSTEMFNEFRSILVQAYNAFKRHEEMGHISASNAFASLRELGLMPGTMLDRNNLERLAKTRAPVIEEDVASNASLSDREEEVDDEGNLFSYGEYLAYLRKVRQYFNGKRVEELRGHFDKLDKDRSGTLSVAELSILLEDLDCLPRSRKEQEEMGQVIQSIDVDGNGAIDFDEFHELIQRIEEKFASMRYEIEMEHALRGGFTEGNLSEFRTIFDMLDQDCSGELESHEVRQCLIVMRKPISQEAFDAAFKSLDADESGCLDFLEFLEFMRVIRDSEGIFAEESLKLAAQARLIDDRLLRLLLAHLNLSQSYLMALDREPLLELFCDSFNITPSEPFQEKLQVRTVGDFMELAKAIGEAVTGHLQH